MNANELVGIRVLVEDGVNPRLTVEQVAALLRIIERQQAEVERLDKLLHERTNMVYRLEGEVEAGARDSAATVLEVADTLKRQQAVIQAAGEIHASVYEWRTDRYDMEHLYLRMGGHEHGFDREDTNPLAMALFKLHDALAALEGAEDGEGT